MTQIIQDKRGELFTSSPIGELKIKVDKTNNRESTNFRHEQIKEIATDFVGKVEPTVAAVNGSNCYTWVMKENDLELEIKIKFSHSSFDFREFTCSAFIVTKPSSSESEDLIELSSQETDRLVKVAVDSLKIKEANNNQLGAITFEIVKRLEEDIKNKQTPFTYGKIFLDDTGNRVYLVQNETFRTPIVLLNGMKINDKEKEQRVIEMLSKAV